MELSISEDDADVAYLRFSEHPGVSPGVVKQSIPLRNLIENYEGPALIFDFDENGILIGVEILV